METIDGFPSDEEERLVFLERIYGRQLNLPSPHVSTFSVVANLYPEYLDHKEKGLRSDQTKSENNEIQFTVPSCSTRWQLVRKSSR